MLMYLIINRTPDYDYKLPRTVAHFHTQFSSLSIDKYKKLLTMFWIKFVKLSFY